MVATVNKEGVAAKPRRRRRSAGGPINDIDPTRWREYDHLLTDSLWVIDRRDRSGGHNNEYHGNYIPQVPGQMMERYTRRGELVLDCFLGGATTTLEAIRLGRHSVGMEINQAMVDKAAALAAGVENPHGVSAVIVQGDSTDLGSAREKLLAAMQPLGKERAQLVMLHPPYLDIIKFSAEAADLSNCAGIDEFISRFASTVELAAEMLDPRRHLCLVIGDCYKRRQWVPLGFMCMQAVLNSGLFVLKNIVVKNMTGSRGKRGQKNLWRYRSLKTGLYNFGHEYIFVFQRNSKRKLEG